ncbi:MAG: hypothetical protein Q7W05_04850 [Deltaproteobacteria bacterium]|nr:hypothetical protein [Deltaproteobacteria bacterium]
METSKQWGLEEYLLAPYEVRVRPKGGGSYLFYIPELGLQHACKSLDEALPVLMSQKEEYLHRFAVEGLLSWVARPGQKPEAASAASPGLVRALLPFAIKAVVVTVLFLGAASVIGNGLNNLGRNLEQGLEGISRWSPDKVDLYRDRSAGIAQKLGPIVRELVVMFDRSVPINPADKPGEKATGKALEGPQAMRP